VKKRKEEENLKERRREVIKNRKTRIINLHRSFYCQLHAYLCILYSLERTKGEIQKKNKAINYA
jgi:hypothetical protein